MSNNKKQKNKKGMLEELTLERMYRLHELARKEFNNHPERSKRYVQLIRKLSERNKVRIPLEVKTSFCRKCNAYWKEGENVRKRVKGKLMNATCLECNTVKRISLEKKKEQK